MKRTTRIIECEKHYCMKSVTHSTACARMRENRIFIAQSVTHGIQCSNN